MLCLENRAICLSHWFQVMPKIAFSCFGNIQLNKDWFYSSLHSIFNKEGQSFCQFANCQYLTKQLITFFYTITLIIDQVLARGRICIETTSLVKIFVWIYKWTRLVLLAPPFSFTNNKRTELLLIFQLSISLELIKV